MKACIQRSLPGALATLFLLVTLLLGSLPQSVVAAPHFLHTKEAAQQPPEDCPKCLNWGIKLYLDGQYRDSTTHVHKYYNVSKVELKATWEGGPLAEGYWVRFSDGGTWLGEPQPEGKACTKGATECILIDKRRGFFNLPGRTYFAELHRDGFPTESTFFKQKVYVDWCFSPVNCP